MDKYYICADLSRAPKGKEAAEIGVTPVKIYLGRMKAVVGAETPDEAMGIGRELILGNLKKGIEAIEWSWMTVKDAERMGDKEIYDRYPTASWLTYYRRKAGLTQQALADKAGVGLRLIQKVEGGEAQAGNLTAQNLLSIADALGVDPRRLL